MESRVIKVKTLNPHITCYLCKGYLVDATTVTECLHTFCKSCLLDHLENDNTCPKCEILIHQSHPKNYISYDRTMQDIVYKMVPNLFDAEVKRREEFCRNRGIPVETLVLSRDSKQPDEQTSSHASDPKGDYHRSDEQVNLHLICDGDGITKLERGFIRCSGQATVTHLKKYLSAKLYSDMKQFKDFDILCNNELMGKDHTMKFIMRTRWRTRGLPLVLQYRKHIDF